MKGVTVLILGGLSGTGKSTVCKILEERGLGTCYQAPPLCFDPDKFNSLSFEVYALARISQLIGRASAEKDSIVDDSPLTIVLHMLVAPNVERLMVESFEVENLAKAVEEYARELKKGGARFVWLTAEPTILLKRLRTLERGPCRNRVIIERGIEGLGLLRGQERRKIVEWKTERLVDAVIDTTYLRPEEVADKIEGVLKGESED